ncbi:MAG: SDR family oxidoreductase [Chloroflexi bacterium]|nr:SDR family oxidoreductase [Chloroflexota bacterium]MYF81438.1 SDR family oxidoreductase [Chloroflexota bacterium]MYI05254.1 SDR family oxidoreductase [Chloroflexota bacterium]
MAETGVQRFQGKVALVTGGASGMGAETSIRLAREGAAVAVVGLPDDSRGKEVVDQITESGGRAIYVGADVSRETECDAAAQATVDAFGRIDLCMAAAGILNAQYVSGEVPEEGASADRSAGYLINKPVEFWEKVLSVNLTGVMLTNRAVARHMISQGDGGAIVNISSGAAKIPMPGSAEYSVSKTGVWMLTRVLALELAPHHIRVNTVAPGVIDTPMALGLSQDEERRAAFERFVPLGRLGEAEDIAEATLFLLSDHASYITGQILHPDGGLFTG